MRLAKTLLMRYEIKVGDFIMVVSRFEHQSRPEVIIRESNDTNNMKISETTAIQMIEEEEERQRDLKTQVENRIADLRVLRLQLTDSNGDIYQVPASSRL